MARAFVIGLLGMGCFVLAGCAARPLDLGIEQREVGDRLQRCLEPSVKGLARSSPGAISSSWTTVSEGKAARSISREGLPETMSATAWSSDSTLLIVLGRAKEMGDARGPREVPNLAGQSVMIWQATGSIDGVDGCFDAIARS